MGKDIQYATQIIHHISEMFDKQSEADFKIDLSELEEGDNAKHFLHAIANIVPNHFYNKLTGDNKNSLEFNHLANQLVFEYSKSKDE